jgi:hypothetical protein
MPYAPKIKVAPVQRRAQQPGSAAHSSPVAAPREAQKPARAPSAHDGLPPRLKAGIESLSGISMDHVKVHYNSAKPAQMDARAYAQGNEIHVGSGQERHLPHEAWHVVQQARGQVRATMQLKGGAYLNNDLRLERDADMMGARAMHAPAAAGALRTLAFGRGPVQRMSLTVGDILKENRNTLRVAKKFNKEMGLEKPTETGYRGVLHDLTADARRKDEEEGVANPTNINIPDKWGGSQRAKWNPQRLVANVVGENNGKNAFGPRRSHVPTQEEQTRFAELRPSETLHIQAHGSHGAKVGGYTGAKFAALLINLGLPKVYTGRIQLNACYAAHRPRETGRSFIEALAVPLHKTGRKCTVRGIKNMTTAYGRDINERTDDQARDIAENARPLELEVKRLVKRVAKAERAADGASGATEAGLRKIQAQRALKKALEAAQEKWKGAKEAPRGKPTERVWFEVRPGAIRQVRLGKHKDALAMNHTQWEQDTVAQDALFKAAGDAVARMQAAGDEIGKGLPGVEVSSLRKRDELQSFVAEVMKKQKANGFVEMGEMSDIVRGRLNVVSADDMATVAERLQDRFGDDLVVVKFPREGYPRWHINVRDAESGLTHEWQVGTKVTTDFFERKTLDIPSTITKFKGANDFHDGVYKLLDKVKDPAMRKEFGIDDMLKVYKRLAEETGEVTHDQPKPENYQQRYAKMSRTISLKLRDIEAKYPGYFDQPAVGRGRWALTLSSISDDCETCGGRATFTGRARVVGGRVYAVLHCPTCTVDFLVWKASFAPHLDAWIERFGLGGPPADGPFAEAWATLRGGEPEAIAALVHRPPPLLPLLSVDDAPVPSTVAATWVRLVLDWEGWVPAPSDADRVEEALHAAATLRSPEAAALVADRADRWPRELRETALRRAEGRLYGRDTSVLDAARAALLA